MNNGLRKNIGFTMAIDPVLEDVGAIGALVFGMIYRYSQMRDGICYASQSTIARRLGLSRRTVNRWISILIEKDYIRLGAKGAALDNGLSTNLYIVTQKCGLEKPALKPEPEEAIPLPPNARSFLDFPEE